MNQVRVHLIGFALMVAPAWADGPPAGNPADFKLLVAGYGLAKDPVYTEELVAISGRIYLFASNSHEIYVIDPSKSKVDFLDLERRLQSSITYAQIEEGQGRVRKTLAGAIEQREKSGKRADQIEADMTRNLAEPRLKIIEEAGSGRLQLSNPSVEVIAKGDPEADPGRLDLISRCLTTIARLGAFLTPNDLPPFVEIETIAAMTGPRKLRPTEISYLYRLAGPPQKFRRTYRLVDSLTDRDREAIRRIERFRESAPIVRYEKYRKSP
ncbi:hypothetical protein P12x_001547 [Tundrisphaera lichenicola]|uniref:hypothetical protein n=1 Tax=Tundrisphaera lichenicola TaxID=2029860 RepID=UPI003EBEADA3